MEIRTDYTTSFLRIWWKWVIRACIFILFADCSGKGWDYQKEWDENMICNFVFEKWGFAYLSLYYSLPKFYWVPIEDMTKSDSSVIHIWDPENGDLVKGRCEKQLKRKLVDKKLGKYWRGPYIKIPPFPEESGYKVPAKSAIFDPWGRKYRMFYFTYEHPDNPELWSLSEKKLIPEGSKGVMIIISGGEDGILQSCAKDKSSKQSIIKTSPRVEDANEKDFKNFDPFNPNITQPDPYCILSEETLKKTKEYQEYKWKRRYEKKGGKNE